MSDTLTPTPDPLVVMPTSRQRPIPILMYHQIATPPGRGVPFRNLTVAPERFARHMTRLQRLGYRGLSMQALQPYLDGERTGRVFGLTFDDGYRNVYDHAMPVLQALGFSATNYVVAGHTGETNAWDAGYGIAQTPLMSRSEMLAWIAAGNEIGSHTIDHADLSTLDAAAARHQIAGARSLLQDLLQQTIAAFCFPYGRYDDTHVELVREAGYDNATTIMRGRARPGSDLLRLPRVTVENSTHFPALLQKLFTPYEDWRAAWQQRR